MVTKEVRKIEKRLERLFDAYMDGDIDADIYKAKSSEYKEKIQKLKNPKEIFELSVFERYKELSHLLSLANRAKTLFKKGTIEEKRVIVKSVLSNWTVEGKELRWKLKKPFEMMAFCSKSSSWQGVRDGYQTLIGVAPDVTVVTSTTEEEDEEEEAENESSI